MRMNSISDATVRQPIFIGTSRDSESSIEKEMMIKGNRGGRSGQGSCARMFRRGRMPEALVSRELFDAGHDFFRINLPGLIEIRAEGNRGNVWASDTQDRSVEIVKSLFAENGA